MLKLGEATIRSVFLGEEKIRKVFLGSKLVYEGVKPSRLPEGYTEVEYIESKGNSYINTSVDTSDTGLKIVMDVEPTTENAGYFFGGAKPVSSGGSIWFYTFSTKKIKHSTGGRVAFYMANSGAKLVLFDTSNKRVTITLDKSQMVGMVNNISSDKFTSPTANGTLALLAYKSYNTSNKISYLEPLAAKLYSCQAYGSGGVTLGDFVPCVNASGVAGLYDLMKKFFYTSVGSEAFTAGPVV